MIDLAGDAQMGGQRGCHMFTWYRRKVGFRCLLSWTGRVACNASCLAGLQDCTSPMVYFTLAASTEWYKNSVEGMMVTELSGPSACHLKQSRIEEEE